MAVRNDLAWPWKLGVALLLVAVIAGMWWWGFDFGQLLSGFNRREIEARVATLEADTATAQREAAALRAQNTQLESELAMMRGLKTTLERQQAEALQENAQLKDELAFMQQFFAEANRQPGLAIQRLVVDGNGADVMRYSALLVRGGTPKGEFDGRLAIQAELVPQGNLPGAKGQTLSLPDDQPESAVPLRLRFKYYQRIEGTFRVPPGHAVRAVTARAYETGVASPRATRTLTLP